MLDCIHHELEQVVSNWHLRKLEVFIDQSLIILSKIMQYYPNVSHHEVCYRHSNNQSHEIVSMGHLKYTKLAPQITRVKKIMVLYIQYFYVLSLFDNYNYREQHNYIMQKIA